MRVVIETQEEYKSMLQEIATAIKAKITFEEKEVDFWDELPAHVKAGILESQEQFKQGKFSKHEEVMAKYKTKYNLWKLFGQKMPKPLLMSLYFILKLNLAFYRLKSL